MVEEERSKDFDLNLETSIILKFEIRAKIFTRLSLKLGEISNKNLFFSFTIPINKNKYIIKRNNIIEGNTDKQLA